MPPWPSSWILELNDSAILNIHFTPMPPIKFRLNLTFEEFQWLIVLEFNDTSTLVGHFVSSPRERENRRDSRRDEREGQGRKRNRSESEETDKIKTFPLYPHLLQGQQALPNCKPISVGRPGDVRYTTPSHHPTIPIEEFQMATVVAILDIGMERF